MTVQSGVLRSDFLYRSPATERSSDGLVCAAFGLIAVLLVGLAIHFHPSSNVGRWIAGAEESAAGMHHQFLFVP